MVGSPEEHQSSAVRVCEVARGGGSEGGGGGGSCGFHLTRTKWDPYPWVSGVDAGSAAALAGLRVGDCVLEVNGEDVLGLRVAEIAARVKLDAPLITLLLWNSGADSNCDPESLCCGPMPSSLQRLAACMGSIVAGLECPVCLETIGPPTHQCGNGHLICSRCRLLTERCPVCRLRFSRGRCLLADQVHNALTEAFRLREESAEMWSAKIKQRLFGKKKLPEKRPANFTLKNSLGPPKNKLLARIMRGKSSSVENLSSSSNKNFLSVEALPAANAGMKKSHSNNEISRMESAQPPNRCPSPNFSSSNVDCSSYRSYQGSTESLSQRLYTDFGENTVVNDDGCIYNCPCSGDCRASLRKREVLSHVRDDHDGPLVQYYKPRVLIPLPVILPENSTVMILIDGRIYFLRILKDNSGNMFVWMWMLADKSKSENMRMVLTLKGNDWDGPELSYNCEVFSLASSSWEDIVSTKRGILITSQTVSAHFSEQKVKLEVNLVNKTKIPVLV
ncbi:uncharacterized protein LOC111046523 [Nilaparvata lugens]|uniref:uncharacterized protein LOC111046523 n=1 Tax=Nilaparvata lugens TaxID=108931 RepID=UPI00193E2ED4|nr:uncharacterized protein LOC111046523 [Nilaparvata lugens]XP_039283226.1 uncharacterized protein LOC111046523 [Nilaparvata lugens]